MTDKQLYKCISEGLMHVAAWYRGTPGPKFTKIPQDLLRINAPHYVNFNRNRLKDVREKRCKIFLYTL